MLCDFSYLRWLHEKLISRNLFKEAMSKDVMEKIIFSFSDLHEHIFYSKQIMSHYIVIVI